MAKTKPKEYLIGQIVSIHDPRFLGGLLGTIIDVLPLEEKKPQEYGVSVTIPGVGPFNFKFPATAFEEVTDHRVIKSMALEGKREKS